MSEPSRWLNENIAGWRALTVQEKKAIRDFPVLWSLFELHATGQGEQKPNADPPAICRAVAGLPPLQEITALLDARIHFSARYFHAGQSTYAWSALRVSTAFQDRVKFGLLVEGASPNEVFLALLLIINRLRNNYLHGEKAAYGFYGQLENFHHANRTLIEAIQLWLDPLHPFPD